MIRKMQEGDLNSVLEIESLSFHDPWNKEAMLYELHENPFSYYWVIETEEKVIGFIGLWITFDSAQITNIAIHPDYRHQGYGQLLMNQAISEAQKKYAEYLTLEVRVSNENAIRFYEKNGFMNVTTKKGYYQDNYEDAYYMVKALQVIE